MGKNKIVKSSLSFFILILSVYSYKDNCFTKILTNITKNYSEEKNTFSFTNMLSEGANSDKRELIEELILNYEFLPKNLKVMIAECSENKNILLKNCEDFYEEGNCEEINPFTFSKKCPENY